MSAIRSRGNLTTEVALAGVLRKFRITGWRRHYAITGTPDFVFPKARIAVFADGCFWHGCTVCSQRPKHNAAYWVGKIARNRARDRLVNRALRKEGWSVVRIWEHDLARRPRWVAAKLRAAIARDPQK